ncbi:MAG: hypothetical protein AB8B86_18370 [Pseudomonadales bacterium]
MKILDFDVLPDDYIKRLGLIVLQSDVTIEDEFRHFFSGLAVSLMVNRIPFENEVTVDTLKAMEAHIGNSMSLFPLDSKFDSLGYGCTSGALHIGDASIAKLANQVRRCENVSSPMQAAIAAMRHVNAKRIAYLAPYSQAVSQTMIDAFEQAGIKVVTSATFDEEQDKIVGRIAPSSIKSACIELASNAEVDAVFVSCTNMKCVDIIPQIEKETGIFAMSSNQVLAWHMARLAGIDNVLHNKGRLFEC